MYYLSTRSSTKVCLPKKNLSGYFCGMSFILALHDLMGNYLKTNILFILKIK